jgi:serine/threonine protein kinase
MIIANKYKLINEIGEGAFGKIYSAENIRTREKVAIKSEPKSEGTKMLKYETKVYKYLGNRIGFPQVKWFGIEEERYFMALTLLDESLTKFKENSLDFSLDYIFLISKKMIDRLEYIHSKGIVHRDIKPDNFLFKGDELYLIDFGLCKKYIKSDGRHIEEKIGKTPIGTANYISVNVHNGIEPSRRDDLESVGYIILFLLIKGNLPWSRVKKNAMIVEEKQKIIKKPLPEFLLNYFTYCRSLIFSERPDYEYLKGLLK